MISWKKIHLPQDNSGKRWPLSARALRGLSLLFALCANLTVHAQAVSDVRVVIDVSGSMKQNDPHNLRTPALRLLVDLLPEGTRSGVWTFAQSVDMSVPLGNIDKAWREKARQAANKIHSHGLLTNIEDAVRKASAGWEKPDPQQHRHLILLTDGMVDLGKDPRVNAESRRRLLEELVPALKQADATVHTIALSADADIELLQAISTTTGGAFEKVKSAEELQRIFLRLFEKSVNADTLPLTDNKFVVDKNISDITVLVFSAKDSPATQLVLPGKQTWSQKDHPASVQWHHENGYDLITVKTPEAGEWGLQAKVDPDNRVLVVTNLRLKVDKLPNTLMLGDNVAVQARLFEDGKTITNPNLLNKTKFIFKQTSGKEPAGASADLQDDGQAPDALKGDGVFTAPLHSIKQAGEYELIIQAVSQTFAREVHHSLHVYDSPANIAITQAADDKPYRISIQPHAGLIRPESVSMQLKLPSLEPQIINHVTDEEWVIEIPAKHATEKFTLSMAATRYDDKPLKANFEQILAVTAKPQSLAITITPAEGEDEVAEEKAEDAEKQTTEEPVEDANGEPDQPAKGFNWKFVLGIVVGANLIVFTGAWLIYRRIRKRRQQQAAKDEKDLNV
jgi:uncharacterized protein (TIGR03503 family)